jgi:hypothetical protein
MEASSCVRRALGLIVVAVVAATASLAAAGILPGDQNVAERLTLQLSDFPAGWRMNQPSSTDLGEERNCPGGPKINRVVTGYSDSAGFEPILSDVDKRSAGSTTHVFSSPAAARSWYAWVGEPAIACDLETAVASWKKYGHGFKVSRLHHVREPFLLRCSTCPANRMDAWRWGFTVTKKGQADTTYVFDSVAVRMNRAVITFVFYSVDTPFGASASRLVSKVLERG